MILREINSKCKVAQPFSKGLKAKILAKVQKREISQNTNLTDDSSTCSLS